MSDGDVLVTRMQRFCTHDGPGVRTMVFLKGCPLRCRWCHNPETQDVRQQILYAEKICIGCRACQSVCPKGAHEFTAEGVHVFHADLCAACGRCVDVCPTKACDWAARSYSIEAILAEAERDRAFYAPEGGITLSGGEPMLRPEVCFALLEGAKVRGLHTAVETCGWFSASHAARLCGCADILLWDYKDSDRQRHKLYTGVDPLPIWETLFALDKRGAATRLRCILVEGVNNTLSHLSAIAKTYHSLSNCQGVDLLPYHAYGASKAIQLGRESDARPEWTPTEESVLAATEWLRTRDVPVSM